MTLYPDSQTKKIGCRVNARFISFHKRLFFDHEDGLRQLLTWFLNLVMEEEALVQAGTQRYERTDSRKASRNGYKSRTLLTRYGKIELSKPQFREFSFETQVFEQRIEIDTFSLMLSKNRWKIKLLIQVLIATIVPMGKHIFSLGVSSYVLSFVCIFVYQT